jgi:phosphatidylglycerophosphate synthase
VLTTHYPTAVPRSRDWLKGRHPRVVTNMLVASTAGRLLLVPIIIATFLGSPVITTAAIALFVIGDVYDGVLARHLTRDDARRRALDSAVDRIAIDSCLIGACIAGALPFALLAAFLARDAYCAFLCARMLRETSVAIKADWVYRGLNLGVAAWAIAVPFISHGAGEVLAVLLLAASAAVAYDLTRLVRRVRSSSASLRDSVVPAGVLRKQVG